MAILTSGCIEIEERIEIRPDASGHVVYRINTSQLGGFLTSIATVIEHPVYLEIKSEAEKFISRLKAQQGIENVSYQLDCREGNPLIQFDFDNAKSYNQALYEMGGFKKTVLTPGYIKLSKTRFKRINFSNYLSKYLKAEGIEMYSNYLLKNITFRTVVVAPDEVRRVRGQQAKIQMNSTHVVQSFLLKPIVEDKINTRLKITY